VERTGRRTTRTGRPNLSEPTNQAPLPAQAASLCFSVAAGVPPALRCTFSQPTRLPRPAAAGAGALSRSRIANASRCGQQTSNPSSPPAVAGLPSPLKLRRDGRRGRRSTSNIESRNLFYRERSSSFTLTAMPHHLNLLESWTLLPRSWMRN
jgi:hypothetical protein